jgi:hypothetical protein
MTRNATIIAFFARSREIGYVRLEHGQLVRYGVKTIKGARRGIAFTRRVEQALLSIIEAAERPRIMVYERRGSCQGALGKVVTALANQRKDRHRVRLVSLEEAKQDLCGDSRATHQALIEALTQRHPALWPLMARSAKVPPYWTTACLALALAEAAQRT